MMASKHRKKAHQLFLCAELLFFGRLFSTIETAENYFAKYPWGTILCDEMKSSSRLRNVERVGIIFVFCNFSFCIVQYFTTKCNYLWPQTIFGYELYSMVFPIDNRHGQFCEIKHFIGPRFLMLVLIKSYCDEDIIYLDTISCAF